MTASRSANDATLPHRCGAGMRAHSTLGFTPLDDHMRLPSRFFGRLTGTDATSGLRR